MLTLEEARSAISDLGIADPLYRGEAAWFERTHSSFHRITGFEYIFDNPAFDIGQMVMLKVYFEAIIDDVIKSYFRPLLGELEEDGPETMEVGGVLYGLLQHYHVPTNFIDLTSDLDVASAFAVEGFRDEKDGLKRGQLYVIDRGTFVEAGGYFMNEAPAIAKRARVQHAVPFFLPKGYDFQRVREIVHKFPFTATPEECERYERLDLYDASDDEAARLVASAIKKWAARDAIMSEIQGPVREHLRTILARLESAGVPVDQLPLDDDRR